MCVHVNIITCTWTYILMYMCSCYKCSVCTCEHKYMYMKHTYSCACVNISVYACTTWHNMYMYIHTQEPDRRPMHRHLGCVREGACLSAASMSLLGTSLRQWDSLCCASLSQRWPLSAGESGLEVTMDSAKVTMEIDLLDNMVLMSWVWIV